VSAEGNKSKASKGFLYSLGGFFIWGGDLMATGDVKRKLTAIFSADVEGYSRLMGEDELATIETLTSHKETMGKLIRQYRGRVVDSTGDNLLAEFASVVDAVQCAVEVQQVLSSKNETLPENRRMHFRIGINSGDVVEEDERIYGDGINVAARVESLAKGGGISISGTAYDQLGKKLPLGYEYLGEQTVKNIEKPVRVYRVLTEAEAAGKVIGEEKPKRKQLRGAAVGAVAVLIIIAGALAIWNFYLRPAFEPASVEKMAFPMPEKPSIAVLPFDNLSGDPEQEYFSDGITEQIITGLSKIPQLFVVARNSSFIYKGKAVKVGQVAEDLGVRYVLEGSVQRSGDSIRITAQLIDAIKGHHLWAESYDGKLADLFALQDDITLKIMTAMRIKLAHGGQLETFEKFGSSNIHALEKGMKGVQLMRRLTKQDMSQARKLLEEAITLDTEYVGAYTLLAMTHLYEVWLGWSKNPRDSMAQAIKLARKSLAMAENFDITHSLIGHIHLAKRQYEKAIAAGERAIELNPNSADAHARLAMTLTRAGRHEEAIALLERAIRLNPYPPNWYLSNLGNAYRNAGKYEEAVISYKKVLKRNPDFLFAHAGLASVYSLLGREDEAQAEAEEILKTNPAFSIERFAKTLLYKNKADSDIVIDGLRRAGLPETPPLPLPDKPSIAVLPFVNMSGDPEQEYFSDGITEEIITALSKTPQLFVIARNSTFTYKGKPVKVQQVGRELGVRYVLEGSVRKAADKVRITAQLVDAQTGNHLWAERYDRDLKDIFALQDEITMKIITELRVKLAEGERVRGYSKGTDNLEAYLKYLQGSGHYQKLNKEDNARARQMFEEAIALDPHYPQAYATLGWTHWIDLWLKSSRSPRESMSQAFELAKKSIALDDSCQNAHLLLSNLYLITRQHEKAIAEGKRAIALDPNSADAYAIFGGQVLVWSGKPEEGVLLVEKAIRLNPIAPSWYMQLLGMAYRETGRYEESITACKKAIKRQPNNIFAHLILVATYSMLGQEDAAHATAAEVLRIDPEFSVEYFAKTRPHIDPANTARFADALRKAGLK
jgi:adenylate cyclase